jgi:hypothetical protein
MRQLIVIASIYFLGCNSESNSNQNTSDFKDEGLLTKDSITKVDSMKWLYYAMNYYGNALFYDSTSKEKIKVKPVECEVRLQNYKQTGKDSSFYIFSFVKTGHNFLYVDDLVYTNGIGVFKNNVYPLTQHVTFDYQNNPDSTNAYLAKIDSSFKTYLRNYQGEISPWLKQEAMRKKILQ